MLRAPSRGKPRAWPFPSRATSGTGCGCAPRIQRFRAPDAGSGGLLAVHAPSPPAGHPHGRGMHRAEKEGAFARDPPRASAVRSASGPLHHEETRSFQFERLQPYLGDPGCLLVPGTLFFWKIPVLVSKHTDQVPAVPDLGVRGLWTLVVLSSLSTLEGPSAKIRGSGGTWDPKSSLLGKGRGEALSLPSLGDGAMPRRRVRCGVCRGCPSWLVQKLL